MTHQHFIGCFNQQNFLFSILIGLIVECLLMLFNGLETSVLGKDFPQINTWASAETEFCYHSSGTPKFMKYISAGVGFVQFFFHF